MWFDLNSPALARYHWGTLFCQFSHTAPIGRKTFVETAAALMAGVAPWNDEEGFRSTAALLHELVHLGQDLTTGLGHADYRARRISNSSLLRYAPIAIELDGAGARPPYRQQGAPRLAAGERDPIVASAHDALRYYPYEMMPQRRRAAVRALLDREFGAAIEDDTLFDLSTQSLLETDAAHQVLVSLKNLGMDDAQWDIFDRNRRVVDPEVLGNEYWGPRILLAQIIVHHTEMSEENLLRILPVVFGIFVDSALAYPPPELIADCGLTADDFDPSVKFGRLLKAFQALIGDVIDGFWNALAEHDYTRAEDILLQQIAAPYPPAEEVYGAWLAELALLGPERDATIPALRAGSCAYRLDNGPLQAGRGVELLFDLQAPVYYLHDEQGFAKTDWGDRVIDPDKSNALTLEMVDDFMLTELAEFLYRTGEFRCPHAQAGICDAVEDACGAGYVHPTQLPDHPDCRARRVLRDCGLDLDE